MTVIDFVFPNSRSPKTWSYKCLKSLLTEDLSTRNMVNVPKHCWNLHRSTFIIFINHCQVNWFGKSLFFWHAKSWDYLLTHWVPMKSILFLNTNSDEIIPEKKTSSHFFVAFLKFRLNFKYFETKYDPHRFCISDSIDLAVIIWCDKGTVIQISTVLGHVYHVACGRVLSNAFF